MCWCNPRIRTPNCGSPGCFPSGAKADGTANPSADPPDWKQRLIAKRDELQRRYDELLTGAIASQKQRKPRTPRDTPRSAWWSQQ